MSSDWQNQTAVKESLKNLWTKVILNRIAQLRSLFSTTQLRLQICFSEDSFWKHNTQYLQDIQL